MIFFFFFCYVSFAPEEAIYASSSEQRDYVKKKECWYCWLVYYRISDDAGSEESLVADFDDDYYETIHLTQVALGDSPAKGPHTVFVRTEEGTIT